MLTNDISGKRAANAGNASFQPGRLSLADVLAPLDELAAHSPNVIANHKATFLAGNQTCVLPRYLFIGPRGGDEPIRLGIFATLNGTETEGAQALGRFLTLLAAEPSAAEGYRLFVYPVCNPTGFEDNTPHSRRGANLSRHFWKNSSEPEVQLLQSEVLYHAFHGTIVLQTSRDAHGFSGVGRGAILTRHLLAPALEAAGKHLPVGSASAEEDEGIFGAPPGVNPRPFEIVLQAPKAASLFAKERAFGAALRAILSEYRKFIAYARNL
jgi:hypothetical protein